LKGYLKIISIRQGSESYLNTVAIKVGSDDDDDKNGGGGDDNDNNDDDEKFPAHTY
jgi:hypothetical protein